MGSKNPSWSWCGSLPDEAKTTSYRGLILVDEERDKASIHLSDGKNSFTGNATRASLASLSDDTIAPTNPATIFEKVHEVFDLTAETGTHHARGSAHVVQEPGEDVMEDDDHHALRVSANWGAEFGLTDVHIDVAAVPLRRKTGNGPFLDAVFARVRESRKKIAEVEEEQEKLMAEIEDLTEARQCLEESRTEEKRRLRLQILVDELNAYKLKLRKRAAAV